MLGIALLLIGSSAFGSTKGYDLKMELSLNGKHISSPRIIVKEGETATVTQKTDSEESFIEVVAIEGTVQNHNSIMMKFVVGTISKNGERTIVSKPQILARENEPAQITVSEKENGPVQLSLSVIAKRKAL